MELPKFLKIISTPLIISAAFFSFNIKLSEVKANNKIIPAEPNDLALYQGMGISYVCSATRKGTDSDFKKSLSVASTLFVTVVQQKHGGKISNGKKKGDQKIDPNKLYNSVNFRLIGGALEVCPDNVPKQMEKDFKRELKRLQELNKK